MPSDLPSPAWRRLLDRLFPNGLGQEVVRVVGYQVPTLLVNLGISILIARCLSPAGKGLVDLSTLLTTFILEFGLLGFGNGIVFLVANQRKPLGEAHGTGLAFCALTGSLLALAGWLLLPFWQRLWPGLPAWVVLLAFGLSPITLYRQFTLYAMQAVARTVALYRIGFIAALATILGLGALALGHRFSVTTVVLMLAVTAILPALIGGYDLWRQDPKLRADRMLAKSGLAFGLVTHVGFVANAVHFKVDQLLLNVWQGPAAVGVYAVAVRWAEMLFLLDAALLATAVSKISAGSTADSVALTRRLTRSLWLISGGFGLLWAIVCPLVVRVLYGDAYREAVWPLVVLIPGIIFWSLSKPASVMLTYNMKKGGLIALDAVIGCLVNIVLNVLFVHQWGWGLVGAAAASTASYGLISLLIAVQARGIHRAVANT